MTQPTPLADLKSAIARLERGAGYASGYDSADHGARGAPARIPLGLDAIDARLPGGGLARGALHEVVGEVLGAGTGFVLWLIGRLLAACGTPPPASLLWCAPDRALYGPGLACHGLDPDLMVMAQAGDRIDRLWAMEEGLRCPGIGMVAATFLAGEAVGLTASRRLHLAAATHGALGILLRAPPPGRRDPAAAQAMGASAAATRWFVTSRPPPGESEDRHNEIGRRAHWRLALVRSRAGVTGEWDVSVDIGGNIGGSGDDGTAAVSRDIAPNVTANVTPNVTTNRVAVAAAVCDRSGTAPPGRARRTG